MRQALELGNFVKALRSEKSIADFSGLLKDG